jgi:bifunctional UDP-N-acetylglucosamine pyrophosphorylase/glucosamine-1-phosphate N-acetyltransferase
MAAAPLRALGDICQKIVVVVGYQAERVEAELREVFASEFGSELAREKLHFVLQKEQRGTGDAVRVAMAELGSAKESSVVVLNGDLPLVRAGIVKKMVQELETRKLHSLCLSSLVMDPSGLGRIVRDARGVVERICEEADATADLKTIKEVNSGIYAFNMEFLKSGLAELRSENKQNEFYLTDLIGIARDKRRATDALVITGEDTEDLIGANSTWELARADQIDQARWKRALCESFGVLFVAADSSYVERSVRFTGAAKIGPGTFLGGRSEISRGVVIEGQARVLNSKLAEAAQIKWGSVITDSLVGARASVGPMAHLRPETELKEDVKVGNFVETKKTVMHRGSKASHLSYLGDAEVGEESNIGCGTITCNYDGVNKHKTLIGKRVFVGSDSQIVAPVKIADGAYVATGTTVTRDVPADALAIGRARMEVKEGYAKRLLGMKSKK